MCWCSIWIFASRTIDAWRALSLISITIRLWPFCFSSLVLYFPQSLTSSHSLSLSHIRAVSPGRKWTPMHCCHYHDNKKIYFAYPSNARYAADTASPLALLVVVLMRAHQLERKKIQKNTKWRKSVKSFHNFHNQIDEVDLPVLQEMVFLYNSRFFVRSCSLRTSRLTSHLAEC